MEENAGIKKKLSISAKPLVSICIPTYNNDKYIKKTIESVLNQSYTNFELIINDDASVDKTLEIISSFNDHRIKISQNNKNLGLVGNFNVCINKVKGKYFKILCGDDMLAPNAIEAAVEVMEQNDMVTVVTGSSFVINDTDSVVMKRKKYQNNKLFDGKKFAKHTLVNGRNYFAEPSVMMFRSNNQTFKTVFDFDPVQYAIDWDMGLTMAYEGQVYYISDVVAYYRISNESTSVKLHKEKNTKVYNDLVHLFYKHKIMGKIKLSNLDFLRYKMMVKLYIVARSIVHKLGGKQ